MRVLDRLIKSIRDTATFHSDVQVAPACMPWPDQDSQWEDAMTWLQEAMPELITLGENAPEKRTGPAIAEIAAEEVIFFSCN